MAPYWHLFHLVVEMERLNLLKKMRDFAKREVKFFRAYYRETWTMTINVWIMSLIIHFYRARVNLYIIDYSFIIKKY